MSPHESVAQPEPMTPFAAAVSCFLKFFDPQLGREVGRGAADEVVARWRQSQDWMVDVAGSYDDRRSLAEFTPPPPLINRGSKIVLIIIGGFIALYWLIGTLADFLH